MCQEEILQKVVKYVVDTTYTDQGKIQPETLIFKEGYFDSMGFVMLLGFIEETFSIKPTDADLVEENFESISAITQFVSQRQAA